MLCWCKDCRNVIRDKKFLHFLYAFQALQITSWNVRGFLEFPSQGFHFWKYNKSFLLIKYKKFFQSGFFSKFFRETFWGLKLKSALGSYFLQNFFIVDVWQSSEYVSGFEYTRVLNITFSKYKKVPFLEV